MRLLCNHVVFDLNVFVATVNQLRHQSFYTVEKVSLWMTTYNDYSYVGA